VSDQTQPLHLQADGFWSSDRPDMTTSHRDAGDAAGVLDGSQGQDVVRLASLDEQVGTDGLDARDSLPVGDLPGVQGPTANRARTVDPTVAVEVFPEEVDSGGLDHANGDTLGVGGLPAVPVAHPVSAPLDTDGAIGIDDPGQVGEDVGIHSADLTSGGEDTPFYRDDWLTVYLGDCREVMRSMPAESVHMVCTSPPYFGLRDYGTATWVGGDEACDHKRPNARKPHERRASTLGGGVATVAAQDAGVNAEAVCGRCGAQRVDSQLGLEPTPEAYVESMVAVFREVRRVLRSDGTVWLNLGDSYATGGERTTGRNDTDRETPGGRGGSFRGGSRTVTGQRDGLKPKDLVGIPWRVAFALQADGWYLRSDIIWSKPNPMPESVTDRPTKSHEYLFLLSKSPRYYFDHEAVREGAATGVWPGVGPKHGTTDNHRSDYEPMVVNAGRNIRSVWTIATQPYPGAHFATFPQALAEPCIKAGTSERGVCPKCGAPWERIVEREKGEEQAHQRPKHLQSAKSTLSMSGGSAGWESVGSKATTTGWRPSCGHVSACSYDGGEHDFDGRSYCRLCRGDRSALPASRPVPATVLDPFAGSGTTGLVAQRLSRRAVLIDLNADYLGQVMDRNRDIPLGLGA
jgi:DNA modification methylase